MTTGGKLILLGTGLLALFYFPTLIALSKLKIALSAVKLVGFNKDSLGIEVVLQVENESGTSLNFQSADLQLFFNQYHVSALGLGINRVIPANADGYLSIVFDVPYKDAVATVWNSIIDGKLLSDYTLTILGTVKVNNKLIKIRRLTFTANEIQNLL